MDPNNERKLITFLSNVIRLANGISRCFSILLLNNRPISSTRYVIKTKKYSLAVLEKLIYYPVIRCSTYFQVACRHCVKKVRIRNFSGPYFPTFGLNTESNYASLRVQSQCREKQTWKFTNTDTFHVVRGRIRREAVLKAVLTVYSQDGF